MAASMHAFMKKEFFFLILGRGNINFAIIFWIQLSFQNTKLPLTLPLSPRNERCAFKRARVSRQNASSHGS